MRVFFLSLFKKMRNKVDNMINVKKIFIIVIIFMILLFGKMSNIQQLSGKEYFHKQSYYVSIMADYSKSVDNVVTLYLNNNISSEDFYNHIVTLRQELDIIILSYNQILEKTPLKVGTHDYYTKLGCESVKNSLYKISDLINICMDKTLISNKDKLVYTYLAYMQELAQCMSDYMLCYSVINYDTK